MNLITRCPACATMFKFVPDQLKIARGWVRCGQCGEVFEAALHRVPDQAVVPGTLTPGQGPVSEGDQAVAMQPPQMPESLNFSAFADDGLADNYSDAPDHKPFLVPEFAQSLPPVVAPQDEPEGENPATAHESAQQAWPQEDMEIHPEARPVAIPTALSVPQEPERIEPTFTDDAAIFKPDSAPLAAPPASFGGHAPEESPGAADPLEPTDELSFIRDAQRKAFWKTPLVRTVLGLLFVLLLVVLSLQWLVRQKDVLAAQDPRLAPLLQALCRPLGCEIRPLRRIEAVRIDSANFSKSGPHAYRLTFVLKNTGDAALEIPALEVTLTDSQDQALVRRVLLPAQFGVTAATLRAHSELAGAVALTLAGGSDPASAAPQTDALPVAGYRILAFYP